MKIAAITGGAQGIGRAIAMHFAEHGYAVSICDVHKDAGLEVIREIRRRNGKAMFLVADVSREEDVERWFRVTTEEFGAIDVLINNAGVSKNMPLTELSVSDWDQVLGVNLRGVFLCSRAAARRMQRQGSGAIINIASTRALMSEADTESYSASKGGILALTHAMAVSLGRYGVRVNAVSPGWIETRDWQYSERAVLQPVHSDTDRLQHPVGRVGSPTDIAEACYYLAGEGAGFITGQNLVIDGGMTVKMIYAE